MGLFVFSPNCRISVYYFTPNFVSAKLPLFFCNFLTALKALFFTVVLSLRIPTSITVVVWPMLFSLIFADVKSDTQE